MEKSIFFYFKILFFLIIYFIIIINLEIYLI